MVATLTRIDDPRDALEKARQNELFKFAQENGVKEIKKDMPATLMRALLRQRGLTRIKIPNRTLGQAGERPAPIEAENDIPTVNATESLMQQYQASLQPIPPTQVSKPFRPRKEQWKDKLLDEMLINDMRYACKAHGILMSRKDTKEVLIQKLKERGFK